MTSAAALRLRLALAVLAWLAQAFMPVAHAALMDAPRGNHSAWCGDPAMAQAALAVLPAEIRAGLDDATVDAEDLGGCALLCALGSTLPVAVDISPTCSLRACGLEPVPAPPAHPRSRSQSPTPPAHAPPAHS